VLLGRERLTAPISDWDFQGGDITQRKLLYNAITRAKRAALLLVFDPKRDVATSPILRLLGPPKVLGAKLRTKAQVAQH
jgi:hypothetical protein